MHPLGTSALVFPLHGVDKGGPLVCPECAAEITNDYKHRRVAALAQLGIDRKVKPHGPTYLTLELLQDTLLLVHPDKHPPERAELASRVTAALLELKPFTPRAPKPKPPPPPVTDTCLSPELQQKIRDAMAAICLDCVGLTPLYYCSTCRARWDERQRKERERERAKQQKRYARRRQRKLLRRPSRLCAAGCGADIKALRADAKFCSSTCRQRAHRA